MNKYFPRTKKEYLVSRLGYDYVVWSLCGRWNDHGFFNVRIPPEYRDLMKQQDFIDLLGWIHENIVKGMEGLTYITFDVLIRISTGLLNKCDIDKDTKIKLHEIIVSQLRDEMFYLINKSLPFQLQIIGLVYSSYCGQTISTTRVTR